MYKIRYKLTRIHLSIAFICLLLIFKPLLGAFRSHPSNNTKENEQDADKKDEASTDPKASTSFPAFRSFIAGQGKKSSDDTEVAKAVYATRPTTAGGRRHSCRV